MTVYVDDMRAPFGRLIMCHMLADTDDELHAMADRIGVARRWWQSPARTSGSHYDIALSKRALAIAAGAVEITWKQAGAMNARRRVTGQLGPPGEAVDWLVQHAAQRKGCPMARIDWIEQRLLNWQRWKLTGGGVLGHAGTSWADFGMPRDTYGEVPIPTSNVEAGETDDAVQRLPSELKATVLEVYLGPGGMRKHCAQLAIGESTLHARIDRAHRLLADHFLAKQDKAKDERARVEQLQDSIRPPGSASSEASGEAQTWQLPRALR